MCSNAGQVILPKTLFIFSKNIGHDCTLLHLYTTSYFSSVIKRKLPFPKLPLRLLFDAQFSPSGLAMEPPSYLFSKCPTIMHVLRYAAYPKGFIYPHRSSRLCDFSSSLSKPPRNEVMNIFGNLVEKSRNTGPFLRNRIFLRPSLFFRNYNLPSLRVNWIWEEKRQLNFTFSCRQGS